MNNNDRYFHMRANDPDADIVEYEEDPVEDMPAYPDIYYILQPHILRECDNMEMDGARMTQHTMERMCDRVYQNVCRTHPELVDYDMGNQPSAAVMAAADPPRRYPDQYWRRDRRYNRDGFGINDLIRIMLLNEILNRRRRRYY